VLVTIRVRLVSWRLSGGTSTTGRGNAGAAKLYRLVRRPGLPALHSNRRTDAIILDALIADDPGSDLIPKVVMGCWRTAPAGAGATHRRTSLCSWLDRYFNTFEAPDAGLCGEHLAGDTYVGGTPMQVRTTEAARDDHPRGHLWRIWAGSGTQELVLEQGGAGRLYTAWAALRADRSGPGPAGDGFRGSAGL